MSVRSSSLVEEWMMTELDDKRAHACGQRTTGRPPHAQRAKRASMLGGRRRASAKRAARRWGAALACAAVLVDLGCIKEGLATGAKSGDGLSVGSDERHQGVARKDRESSEEAAVAGKTSDVSLAPTLVMGGVGVASLMAGAVLIGVAESNGAELQANAPRNKDGALLCWRTPATGSATKAECDAWRSKAAESSALGNASIGLFVVAGAAAAGAAAWLLWPSSSRAVARSWRVVPLVGSDGGGALITGRF